MGTLAAVWGLAGVALLLGNAIVRLAPRAWEALSSDLTWYQWAAVALVVVGMAWSEGYRGFQQAFSPRVAARARYLADHVTLARALLAPLFCMAYFHATRRRQIVSLTVSAGIVVLVLVVRLIPQPWRGIIDCGVVVGLAWGLVALLVFALRAFSGRGLDHSPEVPG
ncbi:MAG: hypothetical protein EXR72_20410 [Myxococcales bacterium]|nr:hypothetical protein [Myxococcales bacterium]